MTCQKAMRQPRTSNISSTKIVACITMRITHMLMWSRNHSPTGLTYLQSTIYRSNDSGSSNEWSKIRIAIHSMSDHQIWKIQATFKNYIAQYMSFPPIIIVHIGDRRSWWPLWSFRAPWHSHVTPQVVLTRSPTVEKISSSVSKPLLRGFLRS
jgi:hypothetical protein